MDPNSQIVRSQNNEIVSQESKDSLVITKADGSSFLLIYSDSGKPELYPIPVTRSPQNQTKTSSIFSDPLPIIIGGILLFTAMVLIGLSITRQRDPYYVESTVCRPTGFLWLNNTCNTHIERGHR